jgi:ribose 1,5-bisphosphokinase PhnN
MRLSLDRLPSIRVPDAARLAALAEVDGVVIVGSTGAGKSTLVDAVRAADLAGVDVPLRLITRPARHADSLVENAYVTDAQLDAELRRGALAMVWPRHLGGHTVRYAFRRPRAGALAVYSANNAIVGPGSRVEPPAALARALIVGIYADDAVRTERTQLRSPDLWERPDELADRLGDPAATVEAHAHLIVDNHGPGEQHAPHDLVELVRAIEAGRHGA